MMSQSGPDVKRVMRAGLSFPVAVKAVLEEEGDSLKALAAREGVNRTALSALLGGRARSPYERERDVLARRLQVSRKWLDRQLGSEAP